MKGQEKTKNLIQEVINLIIKFFKPYGLSDEMLNIPGSVKRMGLKVGFMNLGMTIIVLIFAFMLKITNLMIEYRMILLGIILFMLYRGQQVVRETFYLFESSERKKFELIFEDEIVLRASKIIGKTTNKVLKYDISNNLYKVMSNESVLNTIKNYLQNLWQQKIRHTFDILEVISVIIMLTISILTNESISQVVFIPLIFVFVFISFFSSAYISLNRETYYRNHREYNNEQSMIINDLLRVPVIVNGDLDMRINKFQKTVIESNKNVTKFHKVMNLSRLFITTIEAFSQYGIIVFYLLGVEWNSISLATITDITATLLIIETALRQIGRIAETFNNHNERLIILEKEEKDMSLILDVFYNESAKISTPKVVDNIRINPFSIQYLEESENDKPFTLISKNQICIENGEIVVLYGPSGSGKSTFMKMLTERIRLEKSTEIPSTSRFLFYDEKLKFGSLSIFEELFCCNENPDLMKMQKILENLHLWCEIKSNCFDVWKWMKEKKFEQSLSNGQRQRLILAKMLYWLDDEIDVIVLDECTSGLDDKAENDSADAERILEYIVRYANSDKKRIVIISTHQNIDGFKGNLADEHTFRNLQFLKEGECNLVREI
ncbi:MAG: ATP-binding cassette domain-containing protein [Clostridia bacterium]|nr:ATP-binding cassette domain-containing protein [Clostridia bacterium]